ncbi:MAG TPA: hypothetical protein VKN99_27790 [Polyangia bacterium]|nr:hypothetical protein [Polyangia bacterium]
MALARTVAFGIALGGWAGCSIESPKVPAPGGGDASADGGGRVFADTVIAYTVGGQVTTCVDALPPCGAAPAGSCASNPALGPNDGRTFDLGMGGRIELGFRCAEVVERGSPDDFKIWATVAMGARAVVEVSWDGSLYQVVGTLDRPDETFDLARVPIETIRFVRVSDQGAGGIAIDAVEAL